MARRVALVTGSSRGIGRAIAIELAEAGYDVAVNYRADVEGAKQTLEEIHARGVDGIVVEADVTTPEQVKALFAEVESGLGEVGVLVNNAGIRRDALALRMTDADWHDVIATNLYGPFACARTALRSMVRKRFGRIVNVASVSGLRAVPGQANYAASKAGLIALTKTLAREVAGANVTVNAVAPGLVQTDLTGSLSPERFDEIVGQVPARRPGKAEEVAAAVVFLCSDAAAYVNGAVLVTDGAMTA